MPRYRINCPECATHTTVIAATTAPVACCPFCGNTTLPADDRDEDDEYDDDSDLREFEPDDE
jgi:hypothetical protein